MTPVHSSCLADRPIPFFVFVSHHLQLSVKFGFCGFFHRLKQQPRCPRRARWVPTVSEEEQEPLDWTGEGLAQLCVLRGGKVCFVSAAASLYPRTSAFIFLHSVLCNSLSELDKPAWNFTGLADHWWCDFFDLMSWKWSPNRPWHILVNLVFVTLQSRWSPPPVNL